MAKFAKGDTKKGGRTRGTPNKTTEQFRAMVQSFVENNWQTLQSDFDEMKAGERALFRERLLKYFLPEALNPALLSEDQLKQIVKYLEHEYSKK